MRTDDKSQNSRGSVLFVADPFQALSPRGDSSLALAQAALAEGYLVDWVTPSEIALAGHEVQAASETRLVAVAESDDHTPEWVHLKQSPKSLKDYKAIFIRKDPPFDLHYTSFCWLLALETKAQCFNPPSALLTFHEKTIQFAALAAGVLAANEVIPAVVSKIPEVVKNALKTWTADGSADAGFIIKPWLGYGGRGIHFAKTESEALEIWVAENQNSLQIVQPFDPEALISGDVRVIIAREEIIGCFARKPAEGRVASNLAQGGSAHAHSLTEKQLLMLKRVAHFLTKNQIVFSGLDLIGNRINEINITSPTGLRSIEKLQDKNASRRAFLAMMNKQE